MSKLAAIVVVATLLSACAAHHPPGKPQSSDWSAVMALSVEEHIEVTTKDGRRLSGIVQSADVQQIVLTPVSVILRREDVLSIWAIGRQDSLFNGTLIGALAGLAVGFLGDAEGNVAVALPILSTAVGAVLGGWIDRGWKGPPRKLVYMAQDSSGKN
jgi:uncharacterized protein YcfJ